MQREVFKLLLRPRADSQQLVFLNFPVLPGINVAAVEEHDRSGGRLYAESLRLALNLLPFVLHVLFSGAAEHSVFDRPCEVRAGQFDDSVLGFTFEHHLRLAIPGRVFRTAGQPLLKQHHIELAFAQGDDLRTEFRLLADCPFVLPLHFEVRSGLFGVNERFTRRGEHRNAEGHDR